MQNMWISVALIVAVIIVGIIAGKRLSAPGPQRRAVYFAFGTLAVLALWFFIFVAFFPAEWIVPFFTVACIVIPICVYMMVLRSGGKERAKAPSKRSFEIPKKDITVESAKAASAVSSGTASASSATTPSKAATPAPSASQQTAPASSTPSSTAKTDTSSASATKAKAPATTAVATAPAKPAASEAPKATAKPSAEAPKASAKEAPKPVQAAAKAEAPSTQKSTAESAPVAAPASTKPAESAKSTESQKAKPTKPTKQEAKPASHEAASKPFANKEHVAEIAIEEATEKTPEPPVKAAPATTSPSEDQLREAAEIEILVDRAAEEEAAKIEELVRPFASQATPAMDAEKERELNVGAPVSSPAEEDSQTHPRSRPSVVRELVAWRIHHRARMLDHALDANDRSGLRACNDQLCPRGRESLHPCAHGNRASVWLCHEMGLLLSWLGHCKVGAHYCPCRFNRTRSRPSALFECDRGGHDRTLCSFDLQAPQESSKSVATRIITRKGTE